jgi:hypothetical protein
MLYFPTPPLTFPVEEQQNWQQRVTEAQRLAGLSEAGIVQVSQVTLDLLQRYVRGELTLEQLVRLQYQRLAGY